MSEENVKQHYHLTVGEIIFTSKSDPDSAISIVRLNGIVSSDTTDLPVHLLGKIQQILQVNFHNRMNDPSIEVHDVVIMNIHYLGQFTEDEFQQVPEGMKLQEKEPKKEKKSHLASVPLEQAIHEAEKKK